MAQVATCRNCSQRIEKQPGEFWKHAHSSKERCAPGTRNASTANPPGGWRPH